ncbi:MAG: hypothetical protein M3416_04910 [Acidobacteriota bacterium]|nr:hypothetical protein [Acidobacteriota bacterium]
MWRVCRAPVTGDVQIQLLWRGALAGLTGVLLAVSLSSLPWRPNVYWYVGYAYWLLVSVVLGFIFTLSAWGVQKVTPRLNVAARAAAGGVVGAAAAWAWASWVAAPRVDYGGPADSFGTSIIMMIAATGVVSYILAAPPDDGKKAS